jgi:hypothetical protein
MGQYRTLAEMRQSTRVLPTKCATQIQSRAVTLHPAGSLGIVIVCLRSDAASRLVEAPLKEFANTHIQLGALFGAREVATCDEMLASAQTSGERIASIQSFLLRLLRPRTDSLATRAALHLRRDPTMQMDALAAQLGVSGRHLRKRRISAVRRICRDFCRALDRRRKWNFGLCAYLWKSYRKSAFSCSAEQSEP